VLPTIPSEEGRSKSRKLGKRWNSARPMGGSHHLCHRPTRRILRYPAYRRTGGGDGDGNAREWKNLDALHGADEKLKSIVYAAAQESKKPWITAEHNS
jgi:hypothetical protein